MDTNTARRLSDAANRPFRKRPVIIHAYRTEVRETIETLEGTMIAEPGDWIIKGVKGELYPCKDDIFRATYDEVDAAVDHCTT